MAGFDAETYFNRRSAGKDRFSVEFDGGSSVSQAKRAELLQASEQKQADLAAMHTRILADEQSWAGQLGLGNQGALAGAVNMGATFVENASREVGQMVGALPMAMAVQDEAKTSPEEFSIYQRYTQGKATPADMERLNQVPVRPALSLDLSEKPSIGPDNVSLLQRFERMDRARQFGLDVKERADISGIVHKADRTAFQNDLGNTFNENSGQVSSGYQAVRAGDLSGLKDVVVGSAKMVGGAVADVATNKQAAVETMVGVAPQIMLAMAGRYGAAARNVSLTGYGLENYSEGITNYQKTHNGDYPPEAVREQMQLLAGSLVLAEKAGDIAMGAGGKLISLASGGAKKVPENLLRDSFKQSLLSTGKATASGAAGEFGTEGYQTWAEGQVTGKPATGAEIFTGAVMGAVGGGGIGGVVQSISEAGGNTEMAAKRQEQAAKNKELFKQAVDANDPAVFMDPTSPSFHPSMGVGVLMEMSKKADATEESKQANFTKAVQLVGSLEDTHEDSKDEFAFARLSPQAKQANLDKLSARLAATDPADVAMVTTLTDELALRKSLVDTTYTPQQIRRMEADFARRDVQLKDARATLDNMKALVSAPVVEADVQAKVDLANSPVVVGETPEMATSRQAAVDDLINLSMASTSVLTPAMAQSLVNNASNSLNPVQRSYLRVFSEARIAENQLMNSSKVLDELLNGNEAKNQLGIVQHRQRIAGALMAGNRKAADRHLGLLESFATDHQTKASMAAKAYADAKQNGSTLALVKDNGVWTISTTPLTPRERAKTGGLNISAQQGQDSGKLVKDIATESWPC